MSHPQIFMALVPAMPNCCPPTETYKVPASAQPSSRVIDKPLHVHRHTQEARFSLFRRHKYFLLCVSCHENASITAARTECIWGWTAGSLLFNYMWSDQGRARTFSEPWVLWTSWTRRWHVGVLVIGSPLADVIETMVRYLFGKVKRRWPLVIKNVCYSMLKLTMQYSWYRR